MRKSHIPKELNRINVLFVVFIVTLAVLLLLIVFEKEPEKRYILLSFDVEPVDGERNVMDVLEVVYMQNVSATFFVTGRYAEEFPHIVKLMTGQEIGCHGYSHKAFTKMEVSEKKEEIKRCKKVLKDVSGLDVVGFRAPYNRIDEETLAILEQEGFLYDASAIKGLGIFYPNVEERGIGIVPVSSILAVPLEDVVWLHYLKMPWLYFHILEHKNTELESYLFHPHHIARHRQEFEEFINHLKEENVIFISHRELIEMEDEGV